ncbi:MAG: ABC transporter permease [Oscillospiraceae bacterium]|nr:ABC transporter permease [Oscillospiraceae bacterium]
MLYITITALKLGFMYALVPMALYLSYRVLGVADLTTDGGFVLGAAVSITVAASGHPFLALLAAMVAGACAGFITAFLQTRLGVPSILAGIITNTGLYTINLMVMGWSSNVNLLKKDTVFTLLKSTGFAGEYYDLILVAAITLAAVFLLWLFMGTRMGLSIRATGDNRAMVCASSVNPTLTITVGLCVANAMTSLSGAVVGQYQKSADINSGTGIVVIGLACLIIGETIVGKRHLLQGILAAVAGSLVYRFIYAVVLYTQVIPVECLKLMTAVIVALAIAMPTLRNWVGFQRRKIAHSRERGGT